ncbi:hypothetical protein N8I77_001411 [Diaporthe amygdali]|uniref:Mucoidy inhibitor-like protein n=1 Tax=Phomopsis amygdali TaxID=1214568 RepID=A0AAD9SRZ5_PHOAM|nr:hypothetical protein N8I77_001411 [Diaporthe amygdali]
MDTIHEHEYRIRDLPTRSITLFPTRTQVVRDIKDVILKPGLNQISVIGLTPTVDEHSIKVEGTGSAVISDISVELVENSDIFQEIYPDSDNDDNSETSGDEGSERGSAKLTDDDTLSPAKTALKAVKKEIVALLDDVKRADEVVSSAEKRLGMLDEFGKKFEPKAGAEVGDIVDVYTNQRSKTFKDHMDGTIRQRELRDELVRLRKTEEKLNAQVRKEDHKRNKASIKQRESKRKAEQLKAVRLQKKAAQKLRIRNEREKFWPRSCYTVRITLDATHYTPISSRRSSVSSVTDLVKPVVDSPADSASTMTETPSPACDISISYVTSAAFWSPSYDLQLNTTANTGTLFFDAQLTNNTSEAWKDCKIILSTSQAVFSGLQDDIPKLVPWHIKLAGRFSGAQGDITNSSQEMEYRRKSQKLPASGSHGNTGASLIGLRPGPFMHQRNLFGIPDPAKGTLFGSAPQTQAYQHQQQLQVQAQQMQVQQIQAQQMQAQQMQQQQPSESRSGGLFGSAPASNSFGQPTAAPQSSAFGAPAPRPAAVSSLFGQVSQSRAKEAAVPEPEVTLLEPEPSLAFQESAIEETGLTTTYDLPGSKTLAPSTTVSKQRVANVSFSNVAFSHTVVAKYRPAAFLKAKLRNASKLSLLKGPVGLTLDGTFLGRSTLPRCSSGDLFTMSLGIDPAIKVVYPKADVKRSSSGMFTKENSTAYMRTIIIQNTRGASSAGTKAVRLLVVDQVPVSEDDKLRVEVEQPRGLVEDGKSVSAGVQEGNAKDSKDWGKADATLKKSGEVNWNVELNAGKSVKLHLEYGVSMPAGDQPVQVSETPRW